MGTFTKYSAGVEDLKLKSSGTTRQTFTRTDSNSRTLTLNQIDAADIQFRTIAKQIDDILDGGYDITLKLADILIKAPYYSSRIFADLDTAISTIGATKTTLLIDSAFTVTANATVPSTMELLFTRGGSLNNGTKTVAINGPINAPIQQIFTGTGAITLGIGSTAEVHPEWWGTSSTSNETVQKALDAAPSGSSVILIQSYETGGLAVTDTSHKGKALIGKGLMPYQGSLLGAELKLADSSDTDVIDISAAATGTVIDFTMDGFRIDGNRANNTAGHGLDLTNAANIHIGKLSISNVSDNGLNATGGLINGLNIQELEILNCDGWCYYTTLASDVFINYLITGNGKAGNVGILCDGLTANSIRAYNAGKIDGTYYAADAVVIDANIISIGDIRVNNAAQNGVKITGSDTTTFMIGIGRILTYDNGQYGAAAATDKCGVKITGDARAVFIDTIMSKDRQGTKTQEYGFYFDTTGAGHYIDHLYALDGEHNTAGSYVDATASTKEIIVNSLHRRNAITYAASITPNPWNGTFIDVGTLTGAITVNNVAAGNYWNAQQLTFKFTQDATGGRVVTWGTNYTVNWTPDTAANKVNMITFEWDGTKYRQTGVGTGL